MGKQIEYTEAEKMRRLGRAMVYLIDVLGTDGNTADCEEAESYSQPVADDVQSQRKAKPGKAVHNVWPQC